MSSTQNPISYHTEPERVGGQRYARCTECEAESVMGGDSILHRDGCSEGGRQ